MSNFNWLAKLKHVVVRRRRDALQKMHSATRCISKLARNAEPLECRALLSTITVTSLGNEFANDGVTTFREAMLAAINNASINGSTAGDGADVIQFDQSLFLGGDRTLAITEFDTGTDPGEFGPTAFSIDSEIKISGPSGESGLTISATDNFRLFHVLSSGRLTLERLSVTNGRAIGSNGIDNGAGSAGMGGAIYNQGTVTIRDTYFSDNEAIGGNGAGIGEGGAGLGGAIFNDAGTLSVVNSTLGLNKARGGEGLVGEFGSGLGGAIYSRRGTVTVTSSTLASNIGDDGGALYLAGDGGTATLNATNSIFAYSDRHDSTPSEDLVLISTPEGTAQLGDFYSLIVQSGSINGVTLTADVDTGIQITDPLLELPSENSPGYEGSVPTFALMPNSPAIDAGSFSPLSDFELTHDARGYGPRVSYSAVDIGAYESLAEPAYVAAYPLVKNTAGIGGSGIGDGAFVIPAGVNRVLVVAVVDSNEGPDVDSVRFDGVNATLVATSEDTGVTTSVYVLPLGTSTESTTGFFEVSWTANTNGMYLTQIFHNVDQGNPVSFVTSSQSTTESLLVGATDLAVSVIGTQGSLQPLVVNSNQVTLNSASYDNTEGFVSTQLANEFGNSFSYEATGESVTAAHVVFGLKYATAVNPSAPRITSIERSNPTNQRTSDEVVTFYVEFNEDVQNVDITDFQLSGPAAVNGNAVIDFFQGVFDGNMNLVGYNIDVAIGANSNGNLSLRIKGSSDIQDLEGNGFSGFIDATESYVIDNFPPVINVTSTTSHLDGFTFSLAADEASTVPYVVLPASDPAPSEATILASPNVITIVDSVPVGATVTGLQSGTPYFVYFIAVDEFGHQTERNDLLITTSIVETEVSIEDGVLTIRDISNTSNDTLVIGYEAGIYYVTDLNLYLTTNIAGATGIQTHQLVIPESGISGLLVASGAGQDSVVISSSPSSLPLGIEVVGGAETNVSIHSEIDVGASNIIISGQSIEISTNLKTSSNGQIHLSATRSIQSNGGHISAEAGQITLLANQSEIPLDGAFQAIELIDSKISTTTGTIQIRGTSGDDTSNANGSAVTLDNVMITTTSSDALLGSILIEAVSRQGADGPAARIVGGAGIASVNGSITITGLTESGSGIVIEDSSLDTEGGTVSLTSISKADGILFSNTKMTATLGSVSVQVTASDGFGWRGTNTTSINTDSGNISFNINATDVGFDLVSGSVSSSSGTISLITDRLALNELDGTIGGTGELKIEPRLADVSISIGKLSGVATLEISDRELERIVDGFTSITIGSQNEGAGQLQIADATFLDNVTLIGSSITLSGINANDQTVELIARTGSITGSNSESPNIVARELKLKAETGIHDGSQNKVLKIAVNQLAATTDSGNILLHNDGSLIIGDVDGLLGISILDTAEDRSGVDRIELTVRGSMQVAEAVLNGDTGPVRLVTETNGRPFGGALQRLDQLVGSGESLVPFDFPAVVSLSPDGRDVYIPAIGSDNVVAARINSETGTLSVIGNYFNGQAGISSLINPIWSQVSPDGRHVYVSTSMTISTRTGIVVFDRDLMSGELSYNQTLTATNIESAFGEIVFSSDGLFAYVSDGGLDRILVYGRDPLTGALTEASSIQQEEGVTTGLDGVTAMRLSADGAFLYAAALNQSALSIYSRNAASGALTQVQVVEQGVNGVEGLTSPAVLDLSPDQRFVYVTDLDDAVSIFERDEVTGFLTFVDAVHHNVDGGDHLDSPIDVQVSIDGAYVFVTAFNSNAITTFARSVETGLLTYVSAIEDAGNYFLVATPDNEFVLATDLQQSKINSLSIFRDSDPYEYPEDIFLVNAVTGGVVSIESADDVTLGLDIEETGGSFSIVAGVNTDDGEVTREGGIFIDALQDVVIQSDGSLLIDYLASPTRITLHSGSGSISEVGDDIAVDIQTGVLGLEAKTGIGSDADDIDVAAVHLAAQTNSGDINLSITGSANADQGFGINGTIFGIGITDAENDNSGADNITLTGDVSLTVSDLFNRDDGVISISAENLDVALSPNDPDVNLNLTSQNGTILYGVTSVANIEVAGPLTVGGSFETLDLQAPFASKVLVLNDVSDAIQQRFLGAPEASSFTINGETAYLTYFGGDGNDLMIVMANSYNAVSGSPDNDEFEVRNVVLDDPESETDADLLQTLIGGTVVDSRPAIAGGVLALNGFEGDDSFLLNYGASGGYFFTEIIVDGNDGYDTLRTSVSSVYEYEHFMSAQSQGALLVTPIQDAIGSQTAFNDIEIIENLLTAQYVFFSLTDDAEMVTLTNGGTLDMRVEIAEGIPVNFKNPTSTFGIIAAGGDDSITLQSVDSNFLNQIFVSAGDGDDLIDASLLSGPVGEVGGAGNDTILGSQGADCVSGGNGDDEIFANGDNDLIFGGAGNDLISAGDGDDFIGHEGNDNNDTVDGNGGTDKISLLGADLANQGDRYVFADNNGRALLSRLADPGIAAFAVSIGTIELIEVLSFSGDDIIDASGLTLARLSVDSGVGNDVIHGGSLNDTLIAGGGLDTVTGGDGNDTLLGGAESDSLDGGPGNDRVRGQGADLDVLIGGPGIDTIDGGEGLDIVKEIGDQDYQLTNSQLVGTLAGTDSLISIEAAILIGGATANVINASSFSGVTTLYGGAGADTITGTANRDEIAGDEDDDVIDAGNGNDRINGFGGNDLINAGAGNDLLRGGAGRDSLVGGEGDDKLFGQGSSFDVLSGGNGNDTLIGGAGNDDVSGGDGDDVFVWEDGDGNDILNGDLGTDRLTIYGSKSVVDGDHISVSDNAGRILISRTVGSVVSAFTLSLGAFERLNFNLFGGNDLLDASQLTLARVNATGGFGNDTLIGGSQNDNLAGEVDSDSLIGGGGSDTLNAGTHADVVNGGLGTDIIDVSDADAVDTVHDHAVDQVFSNIDDVLI